MDPELELVDEHEPEPKVVDELDLELEVEDPLIETHVDLPAEPSMKRLSSSSVMKVLFIPEIA